MTKLSDGKQSETESKLHTAGSRRRDHATAAHRHALERIDQRDDTLAVARNTAATRVVQNNMQKSARKIAEGGSEEGAATILAEVGRMEEKLEQGSQRISYHIDPETGSVIAVDQAAEAGIAVDVNPLDGAGMFESKATLGGSYQTGMNRGVAAFFSGDYSDARVVRGITLTSDDGVLAEALTQDPTTLRFFRELEETRLGAIALAAGTMIREKLSGVQGASESDTDAVLERVGKSAVHALAA